MCVGVIGMVTGTNEQAMSKQDRRVTAVICDCISAGGRRSSIVFAGDSHAGETLWSRLGRRPC
jgi:hypothetical protein